MTEEIRNTTNCFEEEEMKDIQNRVATISSGYVQFRASPIHTIRFLFIKHLDETGINTEHSTIELTIDELHEMLKQHPKFRN